MGDIDVAPEELERFAGTSKYRHDDLDDLFRRMPELQVPRDSFGYVPGIGHRVHEAYEQYVDACTDSLASAAEVMLEVGLALSAAADAYAASDQLADARMTGLQHELDTKQIRGTW